MTAASIPLLSPQDAVSRTVYSAVWPETEDLVRTCLTQETEAMLARHRHAHSKHQDTLHEAFFDAWTAYAAPTVTIDRDQFPHHYPVAGSSEAIREIIRSALWKQQDLVIFDGDYEGYEAIASMQGTTVHRVDRRHWRQTMNEWAEKGTPWGNAGRRAQWWISQPSSLDGNVWSDFSEWLALTGMWPRDLDVWVDLCYLGVTTRAFEMALDEKSVAGVVFSLSKTMGAYYRRIGGCFARDEQPGLWGNAWFKNLDSLYLGTRWLTDPTFQGLAWHATLRERQKTAFAWAMAAHGSEFDAAGVQWGASDVALLMYAHDPRMTPTLSEPAARWWAASSRGEGPASRRLCLTPSLDMTHVAP